MWRARAGDWFYLLRASPLTPFVATSYLLGLSAISVRDYMLGTLAALPALLGYVSLGAFARAGLSASARACDGRLRRGFAATPWRSRMSGRSSPKSRAERRRRQPDENPR